MNDFVNYKHGNIRWVINKNYEDKIKEILKETFHSICNQPSTTQTSKHNSSITVIKSNPVRSVHSITIDEKQVLYLKHYKPKGLKDRFKFTFFGSKAKREWETGRSILEKGIVTGVPIAYGENRNKFIVSDNFLLVKSIPKSSSVYDVLEHKIVNDKPSFIKQREFLVKLSHFIIKLHENGILHKDLHGGNILVNNLLFDKTRIIGSESNFPGKQFSDNGRNIGFSIIDLHDVKCKKRFSWRLRCKNLSSHLYSLTPFCTRSEIFLVMKNYLSFFETGKSQKKIIRDINRLIITSKHKHMKSRSKRCLKSSSEFSKKSWKNFNNASKYKFKGFLKKTYNVEFIKKAINLHNKVKNSDNGAVIKFSPRVSVTAIQIENNESLYEQNNSCNKFCVKEYKNPGIFRQIRETFFTSRGKKAWYAANGFIVRKLVTPMPVAFVEKRDRGFLKNSFVITEFIEPAILVYIYVTKCLLQFDKSKSNTQRKDSYKIARKRKFIETFSDSFKNIHKQGVYHADMKGGNILVKEIGENRWEFFYLDLDRVSFKRSITKRAVIKNLIQLNASLPNEFSFVDRMRFYKNYFGKNRLTKADKQLLKIIINGSLRRDHFWQPRKIKIA